MNSLPRRRFWALTVLVAALLAAVAYDRFPPLHRPLLPTRAVEARVTGVIDGDTIEIEGGERVRYIGIDTPEIRRRGRRGWEYRPEPLAEDAKEYNRRLVMGRRVRLEFDVQERDRYGRLLAYVYVDGTLVNAELVRQGYAVLATYPPNVRYVERFRRLQAEAREAGRGVWVPSQGGRK